MFPVSGQILVVPDLAVSDIHPYNSRPGINNMTILLETKPTKYVGIAILLEKR